MKLNQIIIPNSFRYTPPSEAKVKSKMLMIKTGSYEPVSVVDNVLTDGYATYIAAKRLHINNIKTKKGDINKLTVVPSELKQKIYNRDDGICYICGCKTTIATKEERLKDNCFTVDHVIPISKGGKTVIDNLKCCCVRCNSLKGNFTFSESLRAAILNEINEATLQ